jgi:cation diffusion facilitator CzcD-associated flavoprotein CzcO
MRVGIVGAGFAGLAVAIELDRAGLRDYTVFEKAKDLGGVWRENTYPGAGCDIPSPLYSFSYEPHATWPRRFSLQSDIHEYMKNTAKKYGVDDHIRFGTEVTSATFDAGTAQWTVRTAQGETFEFDVLVSAVGQLSRPAMPDIPGMAGFAGRSFHSAHWDHDHDLTGKRVAVIGTGASAIQFVPRIQPLAASLTLFQRTAPYLLPKPDREYRRWHHELFRRVPVTQLAGRAWIWLFCEFMTKGWTGNRAIAGFFQRISLAFLRAQVKDPGLRAKLTPDYQAGCKRVLFANDYYPALAQPNVHLETSGIAEITPNGVRTQDGVEHEADTIIYGTGFSTLDMLAPMTVTGLDGRDLHSSAWADGAKAYLGLAVPGFPNLFLMYGPNTNLGAGSIIYMLERQARYITQIVGRLRPSSYVDVRADVAGRFDAEVQRRLAGSVWTRCGNWYRDAGGRVVTNWPGLVSEYDRRTRTADLSDYHVVSLPAIS